MKRCYWLLIALVVILLASTVGFLGAGRFLAAPAQPPEKADLIAALGGDSGVRVRKAAELYQAGYAPRILLTGMESGFPEARKPYLHWRARYLIDHGVPEAALLYDEASASSWDDAVNTLRLMKAQGMRRVLVVSDPPHLRRVGWVWGKVFAGSGMEYRLIAAPMAGWDAGHWWRNEATAEFVVMEYVKLGYYLFAH